MRDNSGAIVPGATVTITNTDQNLTARVVKSGAQGDFTAPLLKVGTYAIQVSAPGFASVNISGIEVHVGSPAAIPVTLSPGEVSQAVTVSASQVAPQLDTAASATLIQSQQVTGLSLSSRNYLQLMYIQPGISSGVPGPDDRGNITTSGQVNAQTFSVNGNGTAANGYFVDGADTLKRAGQQPVAFPGVDFVQEINLQRANYGAEFGGAGAAFVSVQTKSGAADFHGGAFGFFRSQIFNANTYFNNLANVPRGGQRYADFGYYLSGPVWIPKLMDRANAKTFFFLGQEFLRTRNSVQQNVTNIPTLAQRSGRFGVPVCIAYTAGVCTATTESIGSVNPTAQGYLTDIINKLPVPNNPNDPQGLITQANGDNNETQTLIRIDHQFNDNLSVFMRYLDEPFNLVVPNGFQAPTSIPGVATSRMTNGSTNWLGHVTWVFHSNHVLEGGYSQRANWVTAQAIGSMLATNSPDIQVATPYPVVIGQVPHLSINGSTYAVYSPYNERTPLQQIFVNNTNTLGRHTLKFGVNIELMKGGSTTGSANAGNFAFAPGALPAGGATQFDQAFANFLLGAPSTFTQGSIDPVADYRTNIYEGYAQDDFHASSRLTLTVGLRYTYFAGATSSSLGDGYGKLPLLNFDPAQYDSTRAPTISGTGVICTVAPCAGGKAPNPAYSPQNGIIIGGQNSPYGNNIQTTPGKNFAPRFGFTYDVFGDGKTAVRGGFGLYYFSIPGNQFKFAQSQNYPNILNTTISNPSFANPGNGVPQFSASPNPLQALQTHDPAPYTEQYNLDIQHQLRWGTVVDVGYFGNHGVHLFSNIDINQAPQGAYAAAGLISGNVVTAANTPYLNQIRPYLGYSSIVTQANLFSSNYNSLQASVRKQFEHGGVLTVNYTFSKALTNARTPQNSANIAAEYSHTDLDRTHIFNASAVYPLPFFRGQKGFVGRLAGGFEVSGIVSYGSGQYLTATTSSVDPGGVGLLVGPATGRPDYISNPNTNAPHVLKQWFNTGSFRAVPAGQYRVGSAGPDNIHGPGYENWDLSMYRTVSLKEKFSLQLRAEAYNTFNHTNFTTLQTQLGTSNYGQVTGTGSPRVLQFGAKVKF
ncbi:MAG: carboxypeptidase-like regulatory domain-containing protein [Edaphobacter sp.]|uniref:TonB-dependent receptor n=1 Tax=Edaphobacter sp. TaxID=1934404 RepID=UPI002394BD6B|nr:carboxypeptidase-like regulatory domain-containing protein [Edaphobacter sp.]MDE1177935.1 carboxypeptidase-like regulatory domain-containing protein [Edaphobacter sp.]